jgi:hypothetical protein
MQKLTAATHKINDFLETTSPLLAVTTALIF